MYAMATHYPETAQTWRMQFTSTARCVSLVRTQVKKKLCDWGFAHSAVTTAVLVASELAANAVVHGHVPGHLFEVQLTGSAETCLIEVSDRSPRLPRALAATADDEHGRGLQLTAALSLDVGHRPHNPVGKTLWARLPMTRENPKTSLSRQRPDGAKTAEGHMP
jgi:anti-sigma regulatory factor (Ser/Thr protein kinase)